MPILTPAVFLATFCTVVATVAVGRTAGEDDRDPVDVGTASVVVGIALLAFLWVALRRAWAPGIAAALGIAALCAIGGGLALIARGW